MEITHVSVKPNIQKDIDRMMRSLHYLDFHNEKLFGMMLLLVMEFEHRSAILAAEDQQENLTTDKVEEVHNAVILPFRPRSLQPVFSELLDESTSEPATSDDSPV